MGNFEKALAFVLSHEGEIANDAGDAGGLTKYGISQRSYPDLDILNLSKDQAAEIYHRDFWPSYQGFPEKVATKVFDLAVNMGHRQAVKILQRALRSCGALKILDDGVLGPLTKQAVEAAQPDLLVVALRSEAAGFYRALAEQKPQNQKFLQGWLNRSYQ